MDRIEQALEAMRTALNKQYYRVEKEDESGDTRIVKHRGVEVARIVLSRRSQQVSIAGNSMHAVSIARILFEGREPVVPLRRTLFDQVVK